MSKVGVRELSEHTSEIVRRVREDKEVIELTFRGEVVASIKPVERAGSVETLEQVWEERDRLAAELGKNWPKGLSAAQAVTEDRG